MTDFQELFFEPESDAVQPSPSLIETIGQKAQGLTRIPHTWRPPFFVLKSPLISAFRDCIDSSDANPEDALGSTLIDHVVDLVQHIVLPGQDIILRSSSADEGMEQRGAFDSISCAPSWPSISRCLAKIIGSLPHESVDPNLAIIAQQFINLKRASGHLSNERRISKRKTTWLREFDSIAGVGSANIHRFSSIGIPPLNEEEPIYCRDPDHLDDTLRRLAAWASTQEERLHFEWLWDGEVLWIAQADRSPELKGEQPGLAFRSLTASQPVPKLQKLERAIDVADEGWQKLQATNIFRQCGLPTPEIWILREPKTILQLAQGQFPPELVSDFSLLLSQPIVIRTDLRRSEQGGEYLLPRTETLKDLNDAKTFLLSTVSRLNPTDFDRIAFFIHRFIPSRSSAYAMADPNSIRARIDGIWGLPDGLLYYPHDSFELNAEFGSEIQRKVRFKDQYLDPTENGQWKPKRAGSPWDWKMSLEKEEIYFIAKSTHRLSKLIERPVQVMWFVGIPAQTGHPACLPWYFETEEPPHAIHSKRISLGKGNSYMVRRTEDLRELRQRIEFGENVPLITVRPVPDLLRDKNFLTEVAELAKASDSFVELEGSILSHAYYILRRNGVPILAPDPFIAEESRKTFDKLVRDRVPDKIASHGEHAVTVKLSQNALAAALKTKVLEEALELFWTEEPEELKEEIVDLYTVLESFIHQSGLLKEEVAIAVEEKKLARGGFEEGLMLRETVENPLITMPQDAYLFNSLHIDKKSPLIEEASASIEDLANSPKLEGPNLILPLIPPRPERRHLSYAFRSTHLGININVRYQEKEIVVEFSLISERSRGRTTSQLALFE